MSDDFVEGLQDLDRGIGIFDSSMEAKIAHDPVKLNLSRRIHEMPLKEMARLLGEKSDLWGVTKNKSRLEGSRHHFWLFVVWEAAERDFTGIEDAWRAYLEWQRERARDPENSPAAKQKRDKEAVEIVEWALQNASAAGPGDVTLSWNERAAISDQASRDLAAWLGEREISRRTVEWAERLLQPPVVGPWGEFRGRGITDKQADAARMIVTKALARLSD